MNDPINKPNHYNWHPTGVQCVEISEHFDANISKAIDYLWRYKHKGNPIEDLQKAAWFIQREIDTRLLAAKPPMGMWVNGIWVNEGASANYKEDAQ